jgi:hypothetical protein
MVTYSLADRTTCGQDYYRNLYLATENAGKSCGDCADYHATVTIGRITDSSGWAGGMRDSLINFVSGEAQRHKGAGSGLSVLIAGAADTSTLACSAHAVLGSGEDVFRKASFAVIDRCETPLVLCREFALEHQINLFAETQDLAHPSRGFNADLIIFHTVLSFIPAEYHVAILQRAAAWLNPGGKIYLWNGLQIHNRDENRNSRIQDNAEILSRIRSGEVAIGEDIRVFEKRLENRVDRPRPGGRPNMHPSAEYFDTLLKNTRLRIVFSGFSVFRHCRSRAISVLFSCV